MAPAVYGFPATDVIEITPISVDLADMLASPCREPT
jgi:hypothetical protein